MLENVDLSDGDDVEGNLQMIIKCIQEAGYNVRTFRMIATDFGLPQRRLRIYLCGFHRIKQGMANFQKVERHLRAMRLPHQPPET